MANTPLTRHCCIGFGIERGLHEANAVYVDGEPLVGPRAAPLDTVLADTYRREADQLLADIEAIGGAMVESDRRRGTNDAHHLAEVLRDIAKAVDSLAVAGNDDDVEAAFTFDGPNGGRPIPPAPVIDAREESDHGTDDEPANVHELAEDDETGRTE